MRKIAILAALLAVAAFPSASIAAKKAKEDPAVAATRNTAKFMQDGMMPYATPSKAASAAKAKKAKKGKMAKKSKKKMKMKM